MDQRASGAGPTDEDGAENLVGLQLGGPVEGGGRFREAAQSLQHVAACGVEQRVALQPVDLGERIKPLETRGRPVGPGDGDGVVEIQDRSLREVAQHDVEGGDAAPVCRGDVGRPRVAGGDLGLQGVRAAAELASLVQVLQAAADQQPVPAPAVLVLR